MDTAPSIARCDEQSVGEVVALVDQVFLHDKGRKGSFRERLPNLFSPENADNIYVARVGTEIGGAVIIKPFRWWADDRSWNGVMVGFVCVAPLLRGRGVASSLMRRVQEDLLERKVDFSVLWTTKHSFYQRLGWELADEGMFGAAKDAVPSTGDCSENGVSYGMVDPAAAENLRERYVCQRVVREATDYAMTPPSAEKVDWFHHCHHGVLEAYALVGRRGSTGYLLEMIGDAESFWPLWRALRPRYSAFYVNADLRSAAGGWLAENNLVSLRPQQQALWLRGSASLRSEVFTSWYVPYFDRI